jgi:hypothetical protein
MHGNKMEIIKYVKKDISVQRQVKQLLENCNLPLSEFKYAAMDENREIYLHPQEPEFQKTEWWSGYKFLYLGRVETPGQVESSKCVWRLEPTEP